MCIFLTLFSRISTFSTFFETKIAWIGVISTFEHQNLTKNDNFRDFIKFDDYQPTIIGRKCDIFGYVGDTEGSYAHDVIHRIRKDVLDRK